MTTRPSESNLHQDDYGLISCAFSSWQGPINMHVLAQPHLSTRTYTKNVFLMLWQCWHSLTLPEATLNHKILVLSSSQRTIMKMCCQIRSSCYVRTNLNSSRVLRRWRRRLPCAKQAEFGPKKDINLLILVALIHT